MPFILFRDVQRIFPNRQYFWNETGSGYLISAFWFILCDKGRIFLTFRYWSVQIISEKGRETRTLVPCPWVDSVNEIGYWPTKGKPLGVYLANQTEPGKDWKSYEIIKTILESGSKDEADQMMNMPATLKIQRLKMELVSIPPLFILVKVWKI